MSKNDAHHLLFFNGKILCSGMIFIIFRKDVRLYFC